MNYDIIFMIVGLVVFFFIERIPYWNNSRKKFILRIENERLEIYANLQKLCLESAFRMGQAEHDTLTILAERYPALPFIHVVRIIFDKQYRKQYENNGKKIARKISRMPKNAREILEKLQAVDIKLVIVQYPFSFVVIFFFVLITILRSNAKSLSDSENAVSELLIQKTISNASLSAA